MGRKTRRKRRKEKEAEGEKAPLWALLAAAMEGGYLVGCLSTIHWGGGEPSNHVAYAMVASPWIGCPCQVSLAGPIS